MLALLALAGCAAATYNATSTVHSTAYVTIPCSSGQVITYGSLTTTATKATTLTIEDCSCTHSVPGVVPATVSSAPPHPALANGAAGVQVAGAAGVAAAVAYLL